MLQFQDSLEELILAWDQLSTSVNVYPALDQIRL